MEDEHERAKTIFTTDSPIKPDKYEMVDLEEKDDKDFDQPSIGILQGESDTDLYAGRSYSKPSTLKRSLSRQKSIRQFRQSVTNNTLHFFGLAEDEEEELTRQKWNYRRMRHLSRIGKIKESVSVPSTPDVVDGSKFSSVVELSMQRSFVGCRAKRENAAKLLWKSASRKLSTKPVYDISTIQSFGGRSFAPADLMDDDNSVFESMSHLGDDIQSRSFTPTPTATPSLLDHCDKSFFLFDMYPQDVSTIEEEKSFDLDETDQGPSRQNNLRNESFNHAIAAPPSPSPQIVPSWDRNLGPEPDIQSLSPSAKRKGYLRSQSDRRNRIAAKPVAKKKSKLKPLKREFGKGLVGNLLNRTFNRNRINSKVREQMEEISDHRPYFTYWVSFVQIVILIVMVSIYKFAPVGVSQKTIKDTILISRNGVLQEENLPNTVIESFWIGPSLSTLILLGAKYAPCMRRDNTLFKVLEEERLRENSTGCCLQTYNTGCIQRQQSECSSSFTKFKPRTVCGQDPKACAEPVSKPPNAWDPYSFIYWPVCHKIDNKTVQGLPHMECEVTGRPCCIGTQAQCIITSQDYCKFKGGFYHKDKTLCSQVDCLEATCGLLSFTNKDQPDQFYRLYLSLFLNAGILHVIIVLIFNFTILRDIEKMAGWLRTMLIYMFSGIGGNLWSSILIPYEPEVGPSGAAFGIIACLFVELIQGWQLVTNPIKHLFKLLGIVFVLFLLGLLPYIDNFAHIFGFIYGFLLAFIFLPYVTFGDWDRRRKQIQIVCAALIVVTLTVVGFVLFYVVQDVDTTGVEYFNCVQINDNFCKNFHQGRHLERRETIY